MSSDTSPNGQPETSTGSHVGGGSIHDLLPLVYAELHKLARARMAAEPRDHTLQATALVNEVYLKLAREDARFADSRHFLRTAARAMRQILIDHARHKAAQSHGGGRRRLDFTSLLDLASLPAPLEILAFDEAISRLEKYRPAAAEIVVLRFFGGCSVEQAAELMDISPRGVNREWMYARAWLFNELRNG